MIKLYDNGVYLVNGSEIVEDNAQALDAVLAKTGKKVTKEEAAKGTMAYGILQATWKIFRLSLTSLLRMILHL